MAEEKSIAVDIELLPPLKDSAGTDRVRLRLREGADLRQVLKDLLQRFDREDFRRLFFDDRGLLILAWCAFINGQPVRLTRGSGLATPVKNGDQISFLLNLAGG
jgi:molybdopterin converting factor small subunit